MRLVVYARVLRKGVTYWVRVGAAEKKHDGLHIDLWDSLPGGSRLVVREEVGHVTDRERRGGR